MSIPSHPFIKLNPPASVKQEPVPSPLYLPPPDPVLLPLAVAKTEHEQQQLPSPQPLQQQEEEEQQQQQQQGQPQFLKSIDDLASLSSAIHAFKCRFDDLTKHLDFINQSIDSKSHEPQQQKCPQIETQSAPKTTETDGETEKKGPDKASPSKSSRSEIESLCEMMCSRGLRKYIVTHLSNVPKLREEVPKALKLAPEPATLVLDCIGRFFLQGIKAYDKDSPMIPARQASILVLEFFLLMMGGLHGERKVRVPAYLKEEAEIAAIAWRKRLITEGGLAKSSEVDARGLLLFVACFGIPKVFWFVDLGNLLRLCNLRDISDALKGSPVLSHKMPDIIEAMVKNGMLVEAVDVVSIFGLEDKYSLEKILTLFLQESEKAFKRAKQEAQNSPESLRMANEKHLAALKSVVQYLEDGSSDVAKFLGSWKIEEKIIKMEEENLVLNRRIPKRKPDEMGSSSRVMSQEIKRSRFATMGSPLPNTSHVTTTLAEGMRSYDGLMPNSYDNAISGHSTLRSYDNAISGHATNFPAASSIPRGPAIGSLPRNGVAQMVGINGVGSSSLVTSIGRQHSVGQSASMRFASLYGSSSTVEGFAGFPDTTGRTSTDLYRFADSIGENDSYTSSSDRTGTLRNVATARQSNYMY